MSKLSQERLQQCVEAVLKHALEEKKRKFTETIELQIGLKVRHASSHVPLPPLICAELRPIA